MHIRTNGTNTPCCTRKEQWQSFCSSGIEKKRWYSCGRKCNPHRASKWCCRTGSVKTPHQKTQNGQRMWQERIVWHKMSTHTDVKHEKQGAFRPLLLGHMKACLEGCLWGVLWSSHRALASHTIERHVAHAQRMNYLGFAEGWLEIGCKTCRITLLS